MHPVHEAAWQDHQARVVAADKVGQEIGLKVSEIMVLFVRLQGHPGNGGLINSLGQIIDDCLKGDKVTKIAFRQIRDRESGGMKEMAARVLEEAEKGVRA